jgi:WD40 repeat protein
VGWVGRCDDSNVHMYDAEHAALAAAFTGHASWVLSVAWAPDGDSFVTGSSDRGVKVRPSRRQPNSEAKVSESER